MLHDNNKNIWLDGIMGVAIGDALGLPVQFLDRIELTEDPLEEMIPCDLFDSPVGTWSDDTAMTLAMLDSIRTLGNVDAADIMDRFVRWHDKDEYSANDLCIDEGNTCYDAISNYMAEGDIHTCGKTGEYANGNGSLMRTLPICLYYAEKVKADEATVDEAIEDIHLVSALTHNHIRACMACGLYFFCVSAILYEEGDLISRLQKGLDAGFKFYRGYGSNGSDETIESDAYQKNHEDAVRELPHYNRIENLSELAKLPESEIRSTGYVVDSLEAALWSLATTESYRDAMIRCVNLGDDTDTIAAIAGGLAGLYYGYDSIPDEWLSVLQKHEWIEEMCSC